MLFATFLLFTMPQAVENESPPAATMDLFAAQQGQPQRGPWRAWLDSPGGELPFGLTLHVVVRGKEVRWAAELDRRYHSRGLRIIGLGFELTGDQQRDLLQLTRFRDRWKLEYPLFLAGTANKKKAQQVFPLLAEVKSFPTALILDRNGRVRKIHSGFSGPATGKWHTYMKASYEQLIEELLNEKE
jgi:hypothetical protein